MPFNSALSQDASLQQGEYLELWESTRFTQRQDALGGDNAQIYHPSHLEQDGNGQNMDLPRNHELGAPLPEVDDEELSQPFDNSENEDRHLMENQASSNIRAGGPPTWLSTALLRQQNQSLDDRENAGQGEPEKWCPVCSARDPQSCMCNSSMHAAGDTNATSFLNHSTYTHWLSVQGTGIYSSGSQHRSPEEFDGKDDEFGIHRQQTRMATELNLSAVHGRDAEPFLESLSHHPVAAPRYAAEYSRADWDSARQESEWEEVRKRCLITNHPLYPEMLSKHAACLRVGTPVDQLPSIEAQLSQAPNVTEKYRVLRDQIPDISQDEQADLDRFMTEYLCILGTFKESLQHHVYTDVTEAMMSCWELEQALLALTGVRLDEGCGATMSDDDVEEYDSDYGSYEQGMDYHDSGGYGPLVPTETERTLMERVRQELKHELKQCQSAGCRVPSIQAITTRTCWSTDRDIRSFGAISQILASTGDGDCWPPKFVKYRRSHEYLGYKSKIEDVREEILRKRRAGKLPEGTTTVLKAWWQAHSKWPYPTEDEKELLIQETGLELKQVNNWFINQRKRNWHSNPLISSQSDSKSKVRKSW